MVVLAVIVGIGIGYGLCWLSDALVRFAADGGSPSERPQPARSPALWQLVVRARGGQGASRWFRLHLGAEVLSGLVLAAAWVHFGPSVQGGVVVGSYAFFLLIALMDLKHRLVLNVLTYPATAGVLVVYGLVLRQDMRAVLLGGGFAFFIFGLTAWLQPGKLGGGDVKLATLIGIAFGFPQVMVALLIGGGVGGVVSAVLLASRRAAPASTLPYAPFLCIGAMAALLLNVGLL